MQVLFLARPTGVELFLGDFSQNDEAVKMALLCGILSANDFI